MNEENNKNTEYAKLSQELFTCIVLMTNEEFEQGKGDFKKWIKTLNENTTGLWYVYKEFKKSIYGKIDLPQQKINNVYSIFENWNVEKEEDEKDNDVVRNLYKIREINPDFYYKLAFFYSEITNKNSILQTLDIYNAVNDPHNGINSLSKEIEKQKTNLQKTNSNLDKLESSIENKIKNNVYSEFITILGIFTAITFAIFGGMNLLTNLFKNIGSTQASLGQTLILAAVFGLIMWGIIELLFQWISKIKRTEDDTKDINKKSFNIIALCILGVILILGVVLFLNFPVVKIVHTILKSVHL